MGPARGIRSELLLGATGSDADVEKLMNSLKGVEAFNAKFEVVSPTRLHTILCGGDRLRSSVRPHLRIWRNRDSSCSCFLSACIDLSENPRGTTLSLEPQTPKLRH